MIYLAFNSLSANNKMSLTEKTISFIRNIYYVNLVYIKMRLSVSNKIINKEEYIKEYSERTKNEHVWEFINGYKIKSAGEDVAAICETNILEDYTKLPGLKINPGDIVFDIGAHVGSFSVYAASEGATVYSFEPFKQNYDKLVANIKLNQFESRIIPHNIAITDKIGISDLCVAENDGGVSSFKETNGKLIKIQTTTIAEIIKKYNINHIDFLKIDTEGSEYDVLPNLTKNEFDKIKVIAGEYHNFPSLPDKNYKYLKTILTPYFTTVFKKIPYYFYAVK